MKITSIETCLLTVPTPRPISTEWPHHKFVVADIATDEGVRGQGYSMERAGLDIITDGEMRRESYSNRFATALDGIDNETPATITNRAGRAVKVPRVVGRIRRRGPVEVADMVAR